MPAVVVAALVHAEVAAIRPFVHGNGLVARAMERAVVQAYGLDPTGVAVPEAGHVAHGGPAYVGSLAAYAGGGTRGVGLWLVQAGEALTTAAGEGETDQRRRARRSAALTRRSVRGVHHHGQFLGAGQTGQPVGLSPRRRRGVERNQEPHRREA